MHRLTPRLARTLAACAAVPVILAAAGCSSDSGDGDKSDAGSKSSASPGGGDKDKPAAVQKAAFDTLPEPCKVLEKKTIEDLVPEAEDKSGKSAKSADTTTRGSCSWNGLDSKGVKGSQFRWLNVSLMRYDSNATLGSGEKLAGQQFTKRVDEAKGIDGAKDVKTEPLSGVGDQATLVSYEQKKKEGSFKNQRVVTRVENAVVVIDYNGAGLAGAKAPSAGDLAKDIEGAAKEAVKAVTEANASGGSASESSGSGSGSGSDSGSGSGEDKSDSGKDAKDDADSGNDADSGSGSAKKS
ncbi:hypothetical protein DSC45_00125 [Streptomyces sp. YIM 130001]|uniref:DUF3558 domain-containing protein n=1 Tax=Streptomyces sp. YIM 130001 TaxID=2259644 RepID=UPI000E64E2ED|nr:DUF3558 domain-containing protein [Streptomyces sp. YIM 130001]RII22118.1 hypothetical protein DSC45_00125 [Streptomyces sp. YIM 130001]